MEIYSVDSALVRVFGVDFAAPGLKSGTSSGGERYQSYQGVLARTQQHHNKYTNTPPRQVWPLSPSSRPSNILLILYPQSLPYHLSIATPSCGNRGLLA